MFFIPTIAQIVFTQLVYFSPLRYLFLFFLISATHKKQKKNTLYIMVTWKEFFLSEHKRNGTKKEFECNKTFGNEIQFFIVVYCLNWKKRFWRVEWAKKALKNRFEAPENKRNTLVCIKNNVLRWREKMRCGNLAYENKEYKKSLYESENAGLIKVQ